MKGRRIELALLIAMMVVPLGLVYYGVEHATHKGVIVDAKISAEIDRIKKENPGISNERLVETKSYADLFSEYQQY